MNHFLIMILFAILVSTVFGTVGRDNTAEQTHYGIKIFLEFVGVGLVLAWLLYFLPV